MERVRRTALVVASADGRQLMGIAERPDLVVAADGGLHAVLDRGWTPDLVVGDMDSVDPSTLAAAGEDGVAIERHEVGKDRSDLELAVAAARRDGVTDLHVIVRSGGRLDHQLANLAVLAAPESAAMAIHAQVGDHAVWVVRGRREIPLEVGAHVAVQPVGGAARVTTSGVAFTVQREVLSPFSARGIANRVTGSPVVVEVETGVVLVISSPPAPQGG